MVLNERVNTHIYTKNRVSRTILLASPSTSPRLSQFVRAPPCNTTRARTYDEPSAATFQYSVCLAEMEHWCSYPCSWFCKFESEVLDAATEEAVEVRPASALSWVEKPEVAPLPTYVLYVSVLV